MDLGIQATVTRETNALFERVTSMLDSGQIDAAQPLYKVCMMRLEVVDLMFKAVEKLAASHKAQLNRARGIGSLPPEIIIGILFFTLDNLKWSTQVRNLTRVCTQWHDLVHGTPAFWTSISSRYNSAFNAAALLKSQNHLIDVAYSWTYARRDANEKYLNKAYANLHRWRSADLFFNDTSGQNQIQFLESPAPFLRSFSILFPKSCPTETRCLFNDDAPLLKDLRIDGLSIPWSLTLLKGLTSLNASLGVAHGPSSSQMLQILRDCPDLRELQLAFQNCRTYLATKEAVVPLLFLEKLVIGEESDLMFVKDVLSHIHAPACKSLNIQLSGLDTSLAPLLSAVESLLRPILPPKEARHTLRLHVSPFRLYLFSVKDGLNQGEARPCLLNLGGRIPVADILEHVGRGLSRALVDRVTHLWVGPIDITEPVCSRVLDTLGSFDGIKAVEVTESETVEPLMSHLGRLDHKGGWWLPSLEDIRMTRGNFGLECVLKMVRSRYGRAAGNRGGPAPLKYLRFCAPHYFQVPLSDQQQEIQDVVGERVVCWAY